MSKADLAAPYGVGFDAGRAAEACPQACAVEVDASAAITHKGRRAEPGAGSARNGSARSVSSAHAVQLVRLSPRLSAGPRFSCMGWLSGSGPRGGCRSWSVLSFVFYGYWDWRFIPLLAFSILLNWLVAETFLTTSELLIVLAIAANLLVLGVFKYFNFFADLLGAIPGSRRRITTSRCRSAFRSSPSTTSCT